MTPSDPVQRPEPLTALLRHFGHEYEVDGRQEWHSLNCIYRKTWPMGGGDEPGCIAARAALAAVEGGQPRAEPVGRFRPCVRCGGSPDIHNTNRGAEYIGHDYE